MESLARDEEVFTGTCYEYRAYDIGFSVDLDSCTRQLAEEQSRSRLRHDRKAPLYFNFNPAPLVLIQTLSSIKVGAFQTRPQVVITVFEFGAISLAYVLDFKATLPELAFLGAELEDSEDLSADAESRIADLLAVIGSSVREAGVDKSVESYRVFEIGEFSSERTPEQMVEEKQEAFAAILSGYTSKLSPSQISEDLSAQISYTPEDLTLVTWNAAVLLGKDMGDIRAVLEFANIQLLELVILDRRLNHYLDLVYDARRRHLGHRQTMNSIDQMMVDSAFIIESVRNTLKLFGDPFLARVYSLAARRFGLRQWQESVSENVALLHTIYSTTSDRAAYDRSARLEWIIIILIAMEIVMSLLGV